MKEHFSYSSISRFKKCPMMFALADAMKDAGPGTAGMNTGTQRHADMERWINMGEAPTWAKDRTRAFVGRMMKNHVVANEKKYQIEILGVTRKFVSKLDAAFLSADGTLFIVDWKNRPGTHADEWQLKSQALAFYRGEPSIRFERVEAFFFYLEPDYPQRFEFSLQEIKDFEAEVSEAMGQIENTIAFNARPGAACETCQYFKDCLAVKEAVLEVIDDQAREVTGDLVLRSPDPTLEPAKLEKFVGRVLLLRTVLDKAEDKLKEYMLTTATDEIIINGERIYIANSAPAMRFGKVKKGKGAKDE